MRLIVIEGCDGTGTSTHVPPLAKSLRERGYETVEFHHPPPPHGCSPWARVTHYASERAKLADKYRDQDVVVVSDRWFQSTETFASVIDGALKTRLNVLVQLERHTLPPPVMLALLDASDGELDRRLTKRGESVRPTDIVQREAYRHYVAPRATVTLNTENPKDVVQGILVEIAVAALSGVIYPDE